MPLIWKKRPDAILSIVGPNAPDELKEMAQKDSRIRLLGFVDDIRVPTAEAAVVLCPMRIGSGIKNKILESMAMAKAIVATPMSLAGIDTQPGLQVSVAETAQQIADQAVDLLEHPEKRRTLGRSARTFVEQKHSWTQHAKRFSDIYSAALKEKKA